MMTLCSFLLIHCVQLACRLLNSRHFLITTCHKHCLPFRLKMFVSDITKPNITYILIFGKSLLLIIVTYLYYKVRCVFVCGHSNVPTLTSPPILKLCDTQGYLWLPYDLTEVMKLFGVTFKQKNFFFSKKYFMSFLPHYCHSFRITVIPS